MSGRVFAWFQIGNELYFGTTDAGAVYNRAAETLVCEVTDYASTSMAYYFTFTGETTLSGALASGNDGIGDLIDGTLIHGSLDGHDADPDVAANWQPKPSKSKDRGPVEENY